MNPKIIKYGFEDLPGIIQHLANHKAINIIPLEPGSKKPFLRHWKKYQSSRFPLERLKRYKGNFGVITGDPVNWKNNLLVLDIDQDGIFEHLQDIETLQIKTPSKGYHLYFWSDQPIEDKDYIGKLFNLKIELRGNPKTLVTLPTSSIILEDGNIGSHEVIKDNIIMDVKDVEGFIRDKLINSGFEVNKTVKKGPVDTYQHPEITGEWIRDLEDNEIINLYEHLKPLYKDGQRHDLTLYLGGWMYKGEISMNSGLKVIELLSKNDNDKGRATTFKNSYRGIETKTLKGSTGVYDLIEKEYKDISEDKERIKKVNELYFQIKDIILHPLSKLGIDETLKSKNVYTDPALRELIRFIKQRYDPIVDISTNEVYKYDHDKGYYKELSQIEFKQWIDSLFPEHEFFLRDIIKVKDSISNIKEEDLNHIWFENKLLNTKTLELEDHNPETFTKKRVNYCYNSKATSQLMENKLKDILIDKEGPYADETDKYDFFLQFIGYCFLQNNPFNMMLFITGSGGNGKSVLSSLISNIFGSLVSSVPLHDFYTDYGKQDLIDKLVNIVYDLPRKMLKDTGDLKAVTGEDQMTIQRKYRSAWTGKLGIKIMGMGNHLPKVTDASEGFWQRVAHFETKNSFRNTDNEDKDLKQKLQEDIEGMEWLIYNGIEAYKTGPHIKGRSGWSLPIGNDKTKKEYLRLSNPCYYAAMELFEKTNEKRDFIENNDVVKSITDLLRLEGLEIPANNQGFYQAIRNIGGEDSETSKRVNGKPQHIRGFRMLKFIKSENLSKMQVVEFEDNIKLEIDSTKLSSIGVNSLNPPQKLIIGEFDIFSSTIYRDLMEEVVIKGKYEENDLNVELKDLIDKGVVIEVEENK